MQIVPLQPVASQLVNVLLGGQSCQIHVSQKNTGMFMDLYVSGALIIGGVICENLNRIVRDLYLGFLGDFVFIDTQGTSAPDYLGLGSRFQLAYIAASELPPGQG